MVKIGRFISQNEDSASILYVCNNSNRCKKNIKKHNFDLKCQVKIYIKQGPPYITPKTCLFGVTKTKWVPVICKTCKYFTIEKEIMGGDGREYCGLSGTTTYFDDSCSWWSI